MTWPDINDLHRTAKQLVDLGRTSTQAEAESILGRFVLQVDVGPDINRSPAAQAALLTAVNSGQRAFLGGVVVRIEDDCTLTEGWAAGSKLSEAVASWGGRIAAALDDSHPTVVVHRPSRPPVGDIVMRATFNGWAGGVVQSDDARLQDAGITVAGVVAGALAVSESFQHCLGDLEAGRRDLGLSLWQPDADWRTDGAAGPKLSYLPTSLWLLGLGHLGQAYVWSLGFLPYATPSDVMASLVDTDRIVRGNLATGLLARPRDIGDPKTRLVAAQLEGLGMRTRIVERRFDELMRPTQDEPRIALAGFDDPAPRRLLGENRFARVVDAGLGGGPVEYLDMVLHSFPSNLDPAVEFVAGESETRALPKAYEEEVARRVARGEHEGDATCGMTEVAGITVGAAFVGAIAGALGIGDVLRYLHHGPGFSVIALDLRSPRHIRAIQNPAPSPFENLGFTAAR